MRTFFAPVRTGAKSSIWRRPSHNLRVRTLSHTVRSGAKMIILLRPSRVSHRCELFRTGAKVPFCIDLATIYAFVPRATNAKLAFRIDLATILRARTERDIDDTRISHRPCTDLCVRTASSTIRSGTNMMYLRTPPRVRIGTKSFAPARTCDFA